MTQQKMTQQKMTQQKMTQQKMTQQKLQRRHFSLIELIVVVLILGILAAAASLKLFDYLDDSKITQAKTDIQTLGKAIELYRMDQGQYPEELIELMSQETEEGESKSYLKKMVKDPWGNEYNYLPIDDNNYELISYGRDGEEGGEGVDADITNFDEEELE
jgi:general secretion pathway protein G